MQQDNAALPDNPHDGHHKAQPLFGNSAVPFFTPGVIVIAILAAAGLITFAVRLFLGLGAMTNLNNQYPWGIWIGIDVASGVALAAGGFTMAFIAHIMNNEKYHVLVRPALLTAAIGYTFVALAVVVDLGRYYNIWHVMMPSMWQGNSALFEVGMCVMIYLTVLYIEFLPIVCERFIGRVNLPGILGKLNGFLDGLLRILDKTLSRVMSFFIIAGVVLSCAHQSSLGTLMAIAPSKLYPLWFTPVLPLLFLLSAFAVGLSMAVFESILASRSFKRPIEMHVLSPLARMIPLLLVVYFAAKVIDLVNRDAWPLMFEANFRSMMFWIEIVVGVVIPAFLFLSHRLRRNPVWLFSAAAMVVFGVVLNRFNVFVTGYIPPYSEGQYFPAWTEILLTVGMISLIVLIYRAWVFIFPVLPAEEEIEHA
ncbi:MAG: Ni/Fe-hydrogenase cytochrome b subunit [Candidatus Krumholzibacteria bacterium]|nr:Ni/Fe-hydrogenase cytochrome b subunit [Candidatus Krumholzibacteria bacterium]